MRSLTSPTFTPATLADLSGGNGGAAVAAEARGQARGYAAGYTEGIRAAEQELQTLRTALEADFAAQTAHNLARSTRSAAAVSTALNALNARETPVIDTVHDALAASAVDLAEAILGYELDDKESGARRAIERVLDQLGDQSITRLRMNSDDLALLNDTDAAWPGITFVADPSLARGDATAELADGWLDARISTATARIRRELLNNTASRNDGA